MTSAEPRTLVIGGSRIAITSCGDSTTHTVDSVALRTAAGLRRRGVAVEFLTSIAPDSDGMLIVYQALDSDVILRPASLIAPRTPVAVVRDSESLRSDESGPLQPLPALRELSAGENLHVATLATPTGPDEERLWDAMSAAHGRGDRVTFDAVLDNAEPEQPETLVGAFETMAATASLLHITHDVLLRVLYPGLTLDAALKRVLRTTDGVIAVSRGVDLLLHAGRTRLHTPPPRKLPDAPADQANALAALLHASSLLGRRPRRKDLEHLRDQYWQALRIKIMPEQRLFSTRGSLGRRKIPPFPLGTMRAAAEHWGIDYNV